MIYSDMDKDGELSDNELRTLAVHLHGAPLKPQALSELKVYPENNNNGEGGMDM